MFLTMAVAYHIVFAMTHVRFFDFQYDFSWQDLYGQWITSWGDDLDMPHGLG